MNFYSKLVVVVVLVLAAVVAVVFGQECAPPTLPPGSRWVSNQNCTSGNVYQTLSPPRERCRCWGRCGYICTPQEDNGGTTTTTEATTTSRSSPCPFGPIWYNPEGQRCYCQSHNQQAYYVCESTTTTAGTTTASTTTTAETTTSAA